MIVAFRGFGGPQAMLACETIVEHVATYLKMDPLTIRRRNLFREGDLTHYGQVLEGWNVPRILDELVESSDFLQRQKKVDEFNRMNTYRKRGISIMPSKFGIGFIVLHLNQAGALVHIYKDGSVLLSHGGNSTIFLGILMDMKDFVCIGVEIGQGLHIKMMSIAAEVLRCDINRVRISDTSTDKVPNTSPTSGSVSSDLNGMAVKQACEQLRQRLDTILADNDTTIVWEDLIKKAYFARLDLCAHGFYVTPGMFSADFTQNRAKFNYFTQGAAVTEVELDVLTGDSHVLRTDILMVSERIVLFISIGTVLFTHRMLVHRSIHRLILVKLKVLSCKVSVCLLWKNSFGAIVNSRNGLIQVNY